MRLPSSLQEAHVAVIGLGLMGGSLALALRGRCASLRGVDVDAQVCAAALQRQVVDRAAVDPAIALDGANLVILATPVHVILDLLPRLPAWLPGEALVMDLGSTKSAIVNAMQALPVRLAAVGGHPMCGKEVGGLDNADPSLYQDMVFALARLDNTPEPAAQLAQELALALGARPVWVDAQAHDRWVAATSHVPYLLSAALALATPLDTAPLVGPGFRSASRLAATPTTMMLPVLGAAVGGAAGNRDNVLAALGELRQGLDALQEAVQAQDWPSLQEMLRQAADKHRQLTRPAEVAHSANPQPATAEPQKQEPARRLKRLSGNFFASLEEEIRRLVNAGVDVIRLDIGSPDLPPPQAVVERLAQAAALPDRHGYQAHTGLPALRQAWAETYAHLYGCSLDPNREILPLIGSKEGVFNLAAAWLNAGDVVLAPDPGYMTYARGARFAGAEVVTLPVNEHNQFMPDLEEIAAGVLRRARLLWLNYPANPTGAVATRAFLEQAVAFARRHHLLLAHDAAYSRVYFGTMRPPSILEIPGAAEVAVEFNSLSKSHNMPGWRVGVMVGRRDAVAAVLRLKTNLDSGHFRPILEAAVTALSTPQEWLAARNKVYAERLDSLLAAMPAHLRPYRPQAAIYVWCQVPHGWTSQRYAEAALQQVHVSLTPGTVFGVGGEGFVRLSLTLPEERLVEAMQRLAELAL